MPGLPDRQDAASRQQFNPRRRMDLDSLPCQSPLSISQENVREALGKNRRWPVGAKLMENFENILRPLRKSRLLSYIINM
jgi:hypothetical protein